MTVVVFLVDLHGGVFVGVEGADTHHGRARPFEVRDDISQICQRFYLSYDGLQICQKPVSSFTSLLLVGFQRCNSSAIEGCPTTCGTSVGS